MLFAASNVKSVTILLPMACEMATFKRNSVHFVFVGRDEISMDILKEINGYTEDCDIMFHGKNSVRRKPCKSTTAKVSM